MTASIIISVLAITIGIVAVKYISKVEKRKRDGLPDGRDRP